MLPLFVTFRADVFWCRHVSATTFRSWRDWQRRRSRTKAVLATLDASFRSLVLARLALGFRRLWYVHR